MLYLDKTTKGGACEECMLKLVRAGHELLPIPKVVSEVQVQLRLVEKRMN